MLRWLWRLGLWCAFLWRLSRLELRLVPTHPDGAAGMGYLEVVHAQFMPLVLAISVMQAAGFAAEISTGAMSLEQIYPGLALTLALDALLFIGPLFIFLPKLRACRVDGISDYMDFAERYVSEFDRKWITAVAPVEEPLLGTADLQSLADLNNSVTIVRNMRVVPCGTRLLLDMGIVAMLPMLPLLLLEYPFTELLKKFFERLSGL